MTHLPLCLYVSPIPHEWFAENPSTVFPGLHALIVSVTVEGTGRPAIKTGDAKRCSAFHGIHTGHTGFYTPFHVLPHFFFGHLVCHKATARTYFNADASLLAFFRNSPGGKR
jgi:hypothetical protein